MKFEIDHSSKLPLHYQVEELLRQLIEHPDYQNGKFLPPEVELANMLGVSRNTIRQATNKLEYEGIIVRKKGYGTKVAENSLTTQLNSWHSFTQEMNEKGISFKNFLIKAEWVEAPEKVTSFFNVSENSNVLRITRLRGDANGPFVYFESYLHPRIGVSENEDFTQPLYELLETKYKTPVSISREKIKARIASKITADRLHIKKGEPVLIRERFVSDPGNRPVEYNIGFYVAEKFTYSIEIRR
ncbi:GntR family transcriptional regulator [Maribellus sp. YY47]|uniref:GntR family transcriptional regulator n=1 Tax=Maribellus sp. YY47 TaxID=2929486 RepID=UPI0020015D40|nr:GntR family transcriptional regulator [Maribellus sp. YY47]MCK3683610.1 GntR family transcriptional regulator [Maribellus sp. YY47]